MASVMEMPKLSDTMKEGAIARWLKKEGEKVAVGLPIVEIETDKATMEFESPSTGILLKIIVGDHSTCALNAPIAVIGKADENWQTALDAYNAKKDAKKAAATTTDVKNKAPTAAAQPSAAPVVATVSQSAQSSAAVSSQSAAPVLNSDERLKVSPLARRVAADKGLDLRNMQGSGPGGRIVVRDVESAQSSNAQVNNISQVSLASGSEVQVIPVSMMRKTIARRLTESLSTAPHFFLTISLNMGPLLAWRKQAVSKLPDNLKFSVNDLLVFLLARALRKHPAVNASWKGDTIEQYNVVHIGVAVALPNGLVTPVLRYVERMNLGQIAAQSKELIKAARDGKLQSDAYAGGTFTISNLGMNGIEEFTAIINPPQAAILAVGATIATPIVNDEGEIVVENRMRVTLSCDHRVIDGAVGSEFLKTLKQFVEEPMNALFFG